MPMQSGKRRKSTPEVQAADHAHTAARVALSAGLAAELQQRLQKCFGAGPGDGPAPKAAPQVRPQLILEVLNGIQRLDALADLEAELGRVDTARGSRLGDDLPAPHGFALLHVQ